MLESNEIILVSLNALAYIIVAYFSYKYDNKIILLISVIWSICALMGILYTLNPFRPMYYPLEPLPFIYLFAIFIITLFPFVNFNENYIDKCVIHYNGAIFSFVVYVLALCSYLPTIEIIVKIASQGISNLANDYADHVDTRSHFSFIGKYMFSVVDYFKFVTPVMIFVYFAEQKVRPVWQSIGMILATILPMLNNLAGGQRYYVMLLAYSLLYNFILFKDKISDEIKRKIFKVLIVVSPIVLIIFVSISISRFGKSSSYDEEFGTGYQFIRYMGESMDNFNTESWHITKHLGGHNTFTTFYSYFLGINRDIQEDNDITGVTTNVFSTYVGNLVMDYGVVNTAVYICVCVVFVLMLIRHRRKCIGLESLLLMYLYANILLFGTTYFVYQNGFIHFVFAIFMALLFKISNKTAFI